MIRILLTLVGLGACAGQEAPAIRVNVKLVNVAFTVRDSSGKLVPNLTKDDFEVLDDGSPLGIAFFSRGADLPLMLGMIADISGSQENFVKDHKHDIKKYLKDEMTLREPAMLLLFGNRM